MAGDFIRLRAGDKQSMPQLTDREPAYVRDEKALYVGTPGGNVKLCSADTEGRLAVVENAISTHSGLISTHRETLASHSGALSAHGVTLSEHGEQLSACGETLETHGELLESMEGLHYTHGETLKTHRESILQHESVLNTHQKCISAHETALNNHAEAIGRLETGKLSAVPAVVLPPLAAEADAMAVIAAYNGLLIALKDCGVMSREEVT